MKKLFALILTLVIVFTLFGCSKAEEPTTETTTATTTTETTTEKPEPKNPLTGKTNFREGAVGKRPVAIVVENLSPARPQWAIGSSDIIMEGEVEGGISRMLWLYADYKKVPDKVGPTRSARPSYVRFAKMFDAIYIHWGGSHDRPGYTGGYATIKKYNVDDLDGMKGGELFGRDYTRSVSLEHRGIVNGDKVFSAIKKKGYRRKIDENIASTLSFNDSAKWPSKTEANTVKVTFSNRTDTRKFTYSKKDKKYHTQDWRTDVKFKNIIVLMDETKYITVPYKGATTTYLNYQYKGGKGYYASCGKIKEFRWEVKDGKFVFTDTEGKTLNLNPGKSYIALASSNHEGKVRFE
ncbi:MAG: DUF3048 domain-containing protein [Eubacterium sp.]|nr:DUF3048 domain-containing protein [Eubacterium sp.]